ncbi:hypothetical protein DFQ26_003379 [Actinomortierella ambigua]|nr:hypothetical protein DFQ26_003379 [Actinomortierella ambigua]
MKNLWSTPVGYKFKTNAPLRYSVKPVLGVMAPGQTIEVFALSEAESEKIDSISWRALDARRIVETYIQCSSASPLSLKDQHDDNSSVSSRSSMSSTRSSGSSRSSPSPSRTQSRTTSRTQPVPLRKSSAASGGPTPPGSYPTLFGADKKGSGRVSSSAQTIKSGTSIARGGSSSTLTSPASSSSSSLWSSLSDLRQSLKTLRTFLAVRQYTKLQVVMVSIVCLLVGLLLPFERLFVMVGTEPNLIRPSAGVVTAAAAAAAAAPIRSGVDKSDTNNAAVLKFVDRRKNVVAITNKAVMEALRDPAAAVVLVDPKSKPSGDTRQPDPEGSV